MSERITPYTLAHRFIGLKEVAGEGDNPFIDFMLTMAPLEDGDVKTVLSRMAQPLPIHDEVPWCSAFANFVAWLGNWPRSRSLAARSWLQVGRVCPLSQALLGDVVIFSRGESHAGPDILHAPGHVGFYAGTDLSGIYLLGGNQGNQVSIASFPVNRLLGVRRLILED